MSYHARWYFAKPNGILTGFVRCSASCGGLSWLQPSKLIAMCGRVLLGQKMFGDMHLSWRYLLCVSQGRSHEPHGHLMPQKERPQKTTWTLGAHFSACPQKQNHILFTKQNNGLPVMFLERPVCPLRFILESSAEKIVRWGVLRQGRRHLGQDGRWRSHFITFH